MLKNGTANIFSDRNLKHLIWKDFEFYYSRNIKIFKNYERLKIENAFKFGHFEFSAFFHFEYIEDKKLKK